MAPRPRGDLATLRSQISWERRLAAMPRHREAAGLTDLEAGREVALARA